MYSNVTKVYFITGTDTEVGKTTVNQLIAEFVLKKGYTVVNSKPVACGGIYHGEYFYNEDVIKLQKLNSITLQYEKINPFLFIEPVSPNIAAIRNKYPLSVKIILKKIKPLLTLPVDYLFIEGLGGWSVPINNKETMADVVKQLKIPVILVVGLKLGCLNHTLLTLESLKNSNVHLAGWVANSIDASMDAIVENIQTLQKWIHAPYLGYIPYSSGQLDTSFLNITSLIN